MDLKLGNHIVSERQLSNNNMKYLIMDSLLLALVGLVAFVSGQSPIGCFTEGECLESLYLEVNRTQTPEECLQLCKVRV